MTVSISGSGPIRGANMGPLMSATRTGTAQSIPNDTFTTALFNTVDADTDSAYNPATGLFNPKLAGFYQVNTNLVLSSSAPDMTNTQCNICLNGVTVRSGSLVFTATNDMQILGLGCAAIVFVNGTTDTISVQTYIHTAGGSTRSINFASSWMSAYFVRPA